jgi:hypothetical protein
MTSTRSLLASPHDRFVSRGGGAAVYRTSNRRCNSIHLILLYSVHFCILSISPILLKKQHVQRQDRYRNGCLIGPGKTHEPLLLLSSLVRLAYDGVIIVQNGSNIINRDLNPSSNCLKSPSRTILSSAPGIQRERKLRMMRSASILLSTLFTSCHLI